MESQPPEPVTKPVAAYLARIEALLRQVIQFGRFSLTFEIRETPPDEDGEESPEVMIEFSGLDAELLLEAHAELLNAIEYVVLKAVRLDEELFTKIGFDSLGWRQERIQELRLMAQVAADRVKETGSPFSLSPMNPRERRVVHLALRDRPEVQTASEGFGAERRVVIFPAGMADRRAPAPPPRARRR